MIVAFPVHTHLLFDVTTLVSVLPFNVIITKSGFALDNHI